MNEIPVSLTVNWQPALNAVPQVSAVYNTRLGAKLAGYELILTEYYNRTGKQPVIILDAANKLTSWTSLYPYDLDALLSFFIRVTKEQALCGVVLVTSDYAFLDWLSASVCASPFLFWWSSA